MTPNPIITPSDHAPGTVWPYHEFLSFRFHASILTVQECCRAAKFPSSPSVSSTFTAFPYDKVFVLRLYSQWEYWISKKNLLEGKELFKASDLDNIKPLEIQTSVFIMFIMRIMNLPTIHQCNTISFILYFLPKYQMTNAPYLKRKLKAAKSWQ